MLSGYSKRSLVDKLGLKSGFRVAFINIPENFPIKLGELGEGIKIHERLEHGLDFIHFFTKSKDELAREFPKLKEALASNGMIWISWPKLSSKVLTDLNENLIREIGLEFGLVDIKVCAIDEIWSGLKFVRRLKDRE